MLLTIVTFIIVLGFLIFVHELGHFLAAKLVGIRVERFSLGFPPRMFGKKIGDTDYCISWIPLGGYVKMSGMVDESLDGEITGAPWEFQSKSLWQRFFVIIAGPAMNYLLAVFLFAAVIMTTGIGVPTGPIVGEVLPESPALAAGLQAGDRIVAINEQAVGSWDDVTREIHAMPEQTVALRLARGADTLLVQVTPRAEPGSRVGMIGIAPEIRIEKAGPIAAIGAGFSRTIYLTRRVGEAIGMLISGAESVKESLAGPVGIAKMVGEAAKIGFIPLIAFVAFLSLQLGLLNVLPIPVLDGGHLVFLLLEGVMRRPLSIKIRMVFQQIGMAFLLALMAFIIFNDIRKLF